jgi:hypothetical protein
MRRCMSDRVGRDGRVIPSKELDIMISPLARFRIGVGSLIDSIIEGCFSFSSARLQVPGKWGVGGSTGGGLLIRKVLPRTLWRR